MLEIAEFGMIMNPCLLVNSWSTGDTCVLKVSSDQGLATAFWVQFVRLFLLLSFVRSLLLLGCCYSDIPLHILLKKGKDKRTWYSCAALDRGGGEPPSSCCLHEWYCFCSLHCECQEKATEGGVDLELLGYLKCWTQRAAIRLLTTSWTRCGWRSCDCWCWIMTFMRSGSVLSTSLVCIALHIGSLIKMDSAIYEKNCGPKVKRRTSFELGSCSTGRPPKKFSGKWVL